MKYIKLFEANKQFREVDLQLLYNDFLNYSDELFPNKQMFLVPYFENEILKPLLIDKYIEFHRIENPIDGEISYSFEGKVSSLDLIQNSEGKIITVKLYYDNTDLYYNRDRELKYILAKISKKGTFNSNDLDLPPSIVKIYNSEKLPIEERIEDIKMEEEAKKYNL